jgi:hypothetical protein
MILCRAQLIKRQNHRFPALRTEMVELCRLGSFYKLIEQARRVAHLPVEVRTGARCPSTPEMAKAKVTPLFLTLFPDFPLGS